MWWLLILLIPVVWYVVNNRQSIKIASTGCGSCPKTENNNL